MLTFFHAPNSRSTRVLALLREMDATDAVDIRLTDIPRRDGTGHRDPGNPHPEGKVPALLHDGTLVTETAAVMLYLTTLFPDRGLAPVPGDPAHGACLGWLFWYGNVMEPVLIHEAADLSHPFLDATFRGPAEVAARISAALERGPWLLGQRFSAADLLVHSAYAWFRETMPQDARIRDWVDRCVDRPALRWAAEQDAAWAAAAAA
ncbi:glutathione S-transferase family protein [Rhodobacter sp. Har01]|uniref:glutathione S-transferase family protein n=1 Tax=Rhodobacter sp. Har01 TaxID=2883999 RepID=UPI001D0931D5|nr:glutathione S-transferase family protein [Rhodobacter sp. Har01]MCB6176895.1 glutathione S-transferase family protein [Rhodobacter sp. Har01]